MMYAVTKIFISDVSHHLVSLTTSFAVLALKTEAALSLLDAVTRLFGVTVTRCSAMAVAVSSWLQQYPS